MTESRKKHKPSTNPQRPASELHPRIRTALVSVDPTGKRPAWHGAPTALGVLRGVDHELAVWRPYPGANNIREIALHIAFWENSVANGLSGQTVRLGIKSPGAPGWADRADEIDAAQWKRERKLVRDTHARLVEALTSFDPERLDQPPSQRAKRNAVEFIHGVGEHSLHHATQIAMIKELAKHRGTSRTPKR
ncbi:MAG: DinB family protein [Anaerolineae bacterium]